MTYFVHDSSVIDPNTTIGNNTKIWHFCHVSEGSVIGENCILGQNVFIGKNVEIGSGVKIQNNVSIYENVFLEDDVFCGPSVVFTNVINPRAGIERKDQFLTTTIEKGATLGANSTIICGNTIGRYALVGAGSVVTKDIAPYALVVGNPARQIGWVSEAGEKLNLPTHGQGTASCPSTHQLYKLMNHTLGKI